MQAKTGDFVDKLLPGFVITPLWGILWLRYTLHSVTTLLQTPLLSLTMFFVEGLHPPHLFLNLTWQFLLIINYHTHVSSSSFVSIAYLFPGYCFIYLLRVLHPTLWQKICAIVSCNLQDHWNIWSSDRNAKSTIVPTWQDCIDAVQQRRSLWLQEQFHYQDV
jgi:hypothetical protein